MNKIINKTIALCLSLVLVLSLGAFSVSAAVDTSAYTKVIFEDGGAETPMTMNKWTKGGTGADETSEVTTDGYLVVKGTSAQKFYVVTPNTTIPNNYMVEFSGDLCGGYNHSAGVLFKTVGTTNYYLVGTTVRSANGGGIQYGICTQDDMKKEMVETFVTGVTPYKIASGGQSITNFKLIVEDNTVEVYGNGNLMLTYTNEAFTGEDATTKFAFAHYAYSLNVNQLWDTSVKIKSVKMYEKLSAIEQAENEMTCTLYHNDFEDNTELNSGDCNVFTSGNTDKDSVSITTFDNKGVLAITQKKKSSAVSLTTSATFETEGISDYVVEAKLRVDDWRPDSFAMRYRYTGSDDKSPKYYALGYYGSSSAGSAFGITHPNNFRQVADYKTRLTAYNENYAMAWHTYKIVVSGMTAATYIDGTLVDEQTLETGYETGAISFALSDQYRGCSNDVSLYIDELTIKTRPVSTTKLHKVTTAYDTENGIFRADARVLSSENEAVDNATMILAVYEKIDGVDTLVGAGTVSVDITANGVSDYVYAVVDKLDATKTYTAKLFVLDISDVYPVTKSVEITVQ